MECVQLYLAFYYYFIKHGSLVSADESLEMSKNRDSENALKMLIKGH